MRKKGFTLIELLVVIAILGILMAIGGVGMQGYIQKLRLEEGTRKAKALLTQGRSLALRRSEATYVEVNESAMRLYDSGYRLVQSMNLPYHAKIRPNLRVHFTGRGLPEHQYVFTVEMDSLSRKVVLLPTGKVVIP